MCGLSDTFFDKKSQRIEKIARKVDWIKIEINC
jgi:hypothetical protein